MGIMNICPCECSATITAQSSSTTINQTLIANICPICEADGAVTFTAITPDETISISFQSTIIKPSNCEVTYIGTAFAVSGKGMARVVDISQETDTTFPATFSLNLTQIDDTIRAYLQINGVNPSQLISFFEWQTFFTNDFNPNELQAIFTECSSE